MEIALAPRQGGVKSQGLSTVCILVLLLIVAFACRFAPSMLSLRKLRGGAGAQGARRDREHRIALVLVGPHPLAADARIASFLRLCRWPASVICFAQRDVATLGSASSPVWSVDLLATSRCTVAVMVPWDIDLGAEWDCTATRALSDGGSPSAVRSFYVPGSRRIERRRDSSKVASPPPEVVFPADGVSLPVPDFRCAIGRPCSLAKLASRWFPSFFAGLLAYPLATEHLVQEGITLAADPVPGTGIDDWQPLSETDATTLTALAVTGGEGAALDSFIWRLLLRKPAPYVRLPIGRALLE